MISELYSIYYVVLLISLILYRKIKKGGGGVMQNVDIVVLFNQYLQFHIHFYPYSFLCQDCPCSVTSVHVKPNKNGSFLGLAVLPVYMS